MASPTVDKVVKGNVVMHDHSEADLGAVLDSRYVNTSGDTMTGDLNVPDEAYGAGWNGSTEVPTKNAVYDKVQTLLTWMYDTEYNITNSTPTAGQIAVDNVNGFMFFATGSSWVRTPFRMRIDTNGIDMGFSQTSSRNGYGDTYINGKTAYNFVIRGFTQTPVNGALRINTAVTPHTLEIYMRSTQWYTIIYDLTMYLGKFYHAPFVENDLIRVGLGISVALGANGLPNYNDYDISMGACPPAKDVGFQEL